ncbi:MAG: exopolysaccharide biosynthesis polyprenyl glycosylphosphotransferase [Cyclobacteriaceae bacterium]|nr:exopolysaccharide biosynthesis polyprenyl glycosylphosphotransferase [Cyclobacteriaceae bacterium]
MSAIAGLLFFLGDLIFLNIAILVSFKIGPHQSTISDQVYLYIFSNLTWVYLTLVSNPYKVNKTWSLSKIAKTQLSFLFIHLLMVISLILFLKKSYSSAQIGYIYVFFIPIFFVWKIVLYYLRSILTREIFYKNYILVGRNSVSEGIRKYYFTNPDLGYRFVGYLNLTNKLVNEIKDLNQEYEIHEIFCCPLNEENASLKPLVNFALDSLIKVRIVTNTQQQTIQLDSRDQVLQQNLSVFALDEVRNQILKRAFDLTFSIGFILIVMSWLLPLVALLIKIDSKGPVFFIQKRNGIMNKPFGCIKFRTMIINNEADSKQAVRGDPRITRMGKFLRKSSIDELPQFINVLLGDMSLIGPRPHPIKLNEQFEPLISNIMSRHYVKPGITGLAQCMGYRGETQTLADMENRVRLDRYYIENWTFWLDIKIIFLTVISLIRGSDKAY